MFHVIHVSQKKLENINQKASSLLLEETENIGFGQMGMFTVFIFMFNP